MDQNSLEQQNIKVNAAREEMKKNLGDFFDNKNEEALDKRIDKFSARLDSYQKHGLEVNKEEMIRKMRESINIKGREAFIAHLLKILEPLIIFIVTRPNIFEQIQREEIMNDTDSFKLSEVLYASPKKENKKCIEIHLAPAREFMTKGKIEDFKLEIKNGLIKLAEIIKSNDEIEEIWATSWIVAKSPERLEELGFTFIGPMSEKEREENFSDEKRPIAKAFMRREDFLARYGSK